MRKLHLEYLENRLTMSGETSLNLGILSPAVNSPSGYTPSQVVHAYKLDNITQNGIKLDGSGQTIAIIDAFDAPTITTDIETFDKAFGLPPCDLTVVKQNVNGKTPAPDNIWSMEISLDVEWAHAIAPGAKIMLVEAVDSSNLYPEVAWAANQPGVSVVSMSFGQIDNQFETFSDGTFLTPSGHEGVTFLAASGDRGQPDYPATYPSGMYPALSPNVIGVGATSLVTDSNGNYVSERAASYSGGGYSSYEAEPDYQIKAGINSSNRRVSPDVSFVGGDSTPIPICDSYAWGSSSPWGGVDGTSASTPMFAGIISIADQGRVINGDTTLNGLTQTLPMLYQFQTAFHDVTQGGNQAYQAGAGYDWTTGLGTPIGNILVPELINGLSNFKLQDDVYVIGSGTVSVDANNGVLANDSASVPITVSTSTATGANGGSFIFNSDGSFKYTPSTNFVGFDYVKYTVKDSSGNQRTATVNVLSQPASVVWKFYEQVLHRNPDYPGLQYWTHDFLNGGKTGDIAVGFFESDELLNEIITGYYQQYLDRLPDVGGLDYWINQWHATGGPEEIKANFAASAEFNAKAGNTMDGWLTALYKKVLGRDPDPQGYQYWQEQLQEGESEYKVALQFFDSYEAYKGYVTGWFNEYLGRNPTSIEQAEYAAEMLLGSSDRDIEQRITNLSEYASNPPTPAAGTAAKLPDFS